MSSRALLRNPTWRSLLPGLPGLADAPPALAAAIHEVTGQEGRVRLVRFEDQTPRYARLDPQDGATALFLKIVPAARASFLAEAENLARWLHALGQPVNACLDGYPRRFDRDDMLFAYAYREGRRARADERDLAALGRALAGLHRAMAAYPRRAALEQATERRFAALQETRSALASGNRTAGPEPARVQALAQESGLDFRSPAVGVTPIHDDLNPGNVLMTGDDAQPLFLDFEDALHSVLHVIYDLALVVERFVMVPEPDDARAVALGAGMLISYREAGGSWQAVSENDVAPALRARALRALCTLALSEWSGIAVAPEEWQKFLLFDRLAAERQEVLRRIWSSAA